MQLLTIGLLGGIGWASTAEYYRIINELTVELLGDSHSARISLVSMDQFDFTSRASEQNPHAIEDFLIEQGARLRASGAEFFLFCANGAHRFASTVTPKIEMPFISIVDETAKRVRGSNISKVGLLGVKQTMTGRFYHDRLAADGIDVITPSPEDQERIHEIIYTELVQNRTSDKSRDFFVQVIKDLVRQGAGGVILGCTEIPLLVCQDDSEVPIFNTTEIHCQAAVEFAFGRNLPRG
jgi:aspartate racemase